jgi:hypothetical protein
MRLDRLAGTLVILAAALAVAVAARFPSSGGAVPGPAAFPIGMAVLWGVAGAALIASGGGGRRREAGGAGRECARGCC